MALFVVRHQHAAERCPAQDPYLGAMLLNHLSRPNVRRHGVKIQGEAIVQGEHTLYFIAEADDESRLRALMQPFQLAGSVDIYPASTCARVVASGGCGAPLPQTGPGAVLDPEDACQQAIDAGLVVHRAHPLNCETSIPALLGGVVMPNARFYLRNHFPMPDLEAGRVPARGWRPGRAAPQRQPARSPQHAFADAGRHPGVRRQRPRAVPAADRRREMESGRGQHGGVDRCAAGRIAGSGGRAERRA